MWASKVSLQLYVQKPHDCLPSGGSGGGIKLHTNSRTLSSLFLMYIDTGLRSGDFRRAVGLCSATCATGPNIGHARRWRPNRKKGRRKTWPSLILKHLIPDSPALVAAGEISHDWHHKPRRRAQRLCRSNPKSREKVCPKSPGLRLKAPNGWHAQWILQRAARIERTSRSLFRCRKRSKIGLKVRRRRSQVVAKNSPVCRSILSSESGN